MGLGEEDLGQRLLLCLGTQVEPLERAIDIREGEEAIRVPLAQPLGRGFMHDDPRDEGGAAFDDIVLRFAPFQAVFP